MALETIFRTSDGKEYTNFTEASIHENKLKGIDDLKRYDIRINFAGQKTYREFAMNKETAIKRGRIQLHEDLDEDTFYSITGIEVFEVE